MKLRVRVITHTFPPSRHSNAKRPYYLVKGFLAAGWEVDVFSSDHAIEPGAPETLADPKLRIFRRPSYWGRLYQRSAGRGAFSRAILLAGAGLLWPDFFAGWAIQTLRTSQRMGHFDRTLIFILPASLLLSGLPSRWVDASWLFDYQESVTPQYRRLRRRSPWQRALLPLLAKLERHTLRKSGRVVFTAETNRRAYVAEGLVAENRTEHVPYFFDAEAFREPRAETLPRFQIAYFGTFDWRGARSPETFLHALGQFLQNRPEARQQTSFFFYGNWLPEHNRFIEELKLQDVVSINMPLQYQEYIEKLKQSPILLLVVSAAHNLFMPSKIVDYFGAGRPILSFVPRASEMRQVLERVGLADFACDEFDVAGGAAAIERLWQSYLAGGLGTNLDQRVRFWSSEVQVSRYLELVAGHRR